MDSCRNPQISFDEMLKRVVGQQSREIITLQTELATAKARLAEAEGLLQLIMERTLRIDVGVWQVSWSGNLLDDMMNLLPLSQPSDDQGQEIPEPEGKP